MKPRTEKVVIRRRIAKRYRPSHMLKGNDNTGYLEMRASWRERFPRVARVLFFFGLHQ